MEGRFFLRSHKVPQLTEVLLNLMVQTITYNPGSLVRMKIYVTYRDFAAGKFAQDLSRFPIPQPHPTVYPITA